MLDNRHDEYIFFDEEVEEAFDCCASLPDCEACGEEYKKYDKRMCSCSFTGHRVLSKEEIYAVMPRLKSTVLYLVSRGVTEFHAGGASGFDTLAAAVVNSVAQTHEDVRLVLELPYETTYGHLNKDSRERRFHDYVLSVADEINIHGSKPKTKNEAVECLYRRNRVLMDKSHFCVCYLKTDKGGTAYTVEYAKSIDCQIINIAH